MCSFNCSRYECTTARKETLGECEIENNRMRIARSALQGMIANKYSFGPSFQGNPKALAEFAVECSDALLAELAKPQEKP